MDYATAQGVEPFVVQHSNYIGLKYGLVATDYFERIVRSVDVSRDGKITMAGDFTGIINEMVDKSV